MIISSAFDTRGIRLNTDAAARTVRLRKLMADHRLTARQVGDILGRKPHTVRCWKSAWEDRAIPEHALALLELRIAREP